MKQLFAAAIAGVFMLASCKKETIIGNGSTATEVRSLSGFTKVDVAGKTGVIISQGPAFKVEVKAFTNLLPQLETKVVGDVLKIGYKSGTSVSNDNSVVTITMPLLNGFHTTGNSDVTIQNGAATDFEAVVTGASSIRAFNFTAQNGTVNIEGSGSVELSVTDKLKAKIVGSGNIYYRGNPTTVITDITGTGKVERR